MWRSVCASISCTETRIWLPDLRTLPSTTLPTPSCCAISLRLRVIPLLYCITDVRLITFKSLILERFDNSSSWIPSAKKAFSFFADGIQDELLSNLSKIKDLKVISRTSVMQYKSGITRNLKEIAQQLGVSSVVEGSVRRSGNHIRVSVQLIDAATDRHVWSQTYDRTMADSLALQGELAIEIANAIGATLSPQEKARVEATPTTNTDAYQA